MQHSTILKRRQWTQHAWIAFVAATGLFTAVAWGGAYVLRPREVDGQHLTILEHVYGQNTDRARSWITLLLPWYGSKSVTIGSDETEARASSITPWDAPGTNAGTTSFPDAKQYPVDGRAAGSVTVPTRATVKQFQLEWSGPPLLGWAMPGPVIADTPGGAFRLGGEIKVVRREFPEPVGGRVVQGEREVLDGSIMHNLPGGLRNVQIVWVKPMRSLNGTPVAFMPAGEASIIALASSDMWKPGEVIDLTPISLNMNATALIDSYLETYLQPDTMGNLISDPLSRGRPNLPQMMAAAFLPVFPPPDLTKVLSGNGRVPALGSRQLFHRLDLGRWFTQPCVIVLGIADASTGAGSLPIPLSVDGGDPLVDRTKLSGTTMIRWVYPLAESPPSLNLGEETK